MITTTQNASEMLTKQFGKQEDQAKRRGQRDALRRELESRSGYGAKYVPKLYDPNEGA